MINFRDFEYARMIVQLEHALHSFRNQPGGVQSSDKFGAEVAIAFATATNMSDDETDKLANQTWQFIQRGVPGNIDWRKGVRIRTAPRPDRMLILKHYLYREGWMHPSDWLPHLIDMDTAVEFAEKHGVSPHANQTIIGGRIFGDAYYEHHSDDRAELIILQWVHVEGEPWMRVRRFTLVVERRPFESGSDFKNRIERLDADYGFMEDQLGNLGSDWGEVWVPQPGVRPTTISNYEWQFERKNRILGFTETNHLGNARRFEFPRKPDQIARMHAVQAKVDEIERFQEAAE